MASNFKVGGTDIDNSFINRSYTVAGDLFNSTADTLWGWGHNGPIYISGTGTFVHLLGNPRAPNIVTRPTQIGTQSGWSQVAGGYAASTAIKTDGTLWAWGKNPNGWGILYSPTQIGTSTDWNQISSSENTSIYSDTGGNAVLLTKTDGTLWALGYHQYGLGTGSTSQYGTPAQIGTGTNWSSIDVSYLGSVAIKTDGTIWTWGSNYYGYLGLGDTVHRSTPVQVGTLTNWKQAANAVHSGGLGQTYAVKTDGTLWTWGYNYTLNVSGVSQGAKSSPVQVGALTNWKQVAGDEYVIGAVKTDGTLWTWGGRNSADISFNLSLGQGSSAANLSPTQVGALTDWSAVYKNGKVMFATKTDGTLWAWGHNYKNMLGLQESYMSPVQVGAKNNWKQVSPSYGNTLAIQL